MKIAAHKNPKGITNTRNKLAIPTGIWRIAWLYKKNGIASEKTKYTKVIIVPDEAWKGSSKFPKKIRLKNIITVAETIWLEVTTNVEIFVVTSSQQLAKSHQAKNSQQKYVPQKTIFIYNLFS